MLRWLARLSVAGVEPMSCGLQLSRSTLYSHLNRLSRAGLVAPVGLRDGEGGIFAVTECGAALVRAEGVPAGRPRLTRLTMSRHACAVSWVAASADLRGTSWLGPSALRQGERWRLHRADGHRHLPDLGLARDGRRAAVEVELTSKGPDRLRRIVLAYRSHLDRGLFDEVIYVCDQSAVVRLLERVGRPVLGHRLEVVDLHEMIDRTRQLARDGEQA